MRLCALCLLCIKLQLFSLIPIYLFHFPPYSRIFTSTSISSSSQGHSVCFASLFFSNSPLRVFEFTATASLTSHCFFAALHFVAPHLFVPSFIIQHVLSAQSVCECALCVCPTFTPHHNMADQVRSLDAHNFK